MSVHLMLTFKEKIGLDGSAEDFIKVVGNAPHAIPWVAEESVPKAWKKCWS
jgi:hypothetical protein